MAKQSVEMASRVRVVGFMQTSPEKRETKNRAFFFAHASPGMQARSLHR
jgi:hypothetical protein